MNQKEVSALINLLDDPDDAIFEQISSKIISLGNEVIPFLESAWESSFDTVLQQRIENLIHTIQFGEVRNNLVEWKQDEGKDLLKGVILIAKYQYPDFDEEKFYAQLKKIKDDIWLELNPNLTALEQIKVVNHVFFDVYGFSGNTGNFHAPQNSYINTVLETKKGNPLSLSIIYSHLCQELDVPVFGVNLPEHFILAYVEENVLWKISQLDEGSNVLFYINTFSKGTIFSKKEIDSFLKQLKLEPSKKYYEPCSNIDIVKRLLRNLIGAYEKLGYPEKVNEIKELLSCF
ncbi:MAG: transglutaminase-like domain-containing protein [Bacteroidota bacterium]